MTDKSPSCASDVELPRKVVELQHLKTKSGEPVQVLCELADELAIARVVKALPGRRPKRAGLDIEPEKPDPSLALQRAEEFDQFGPALIEIGTSLVDAEGNAVRPAFYFDESKPRHPASLPGKLLRFADRVLLAHTIMQLGGYVGGAADEASFPAGRREGSAGVLGTVEAGESNGADAVGSTAR